MVPAPPSPVAKAVSGFPGWPKAQRSGKQRGRQFVAFLRERDAMESTDGVFGRQRPRTPRLSPGRTGNQLDLEMVGIGKCQHLLFKSRKGTVKTDLLFSQAIHPELQAARWNRE